MLKLFIPRDLLTWIDLNRGDMSRCVFIISTLYEVKENS